MCVGDDRTVLYYIIYCAPLIAWRHIAADSAICTAAMRGKRPRNYADSLVKLSILSWFLLIHPSRGFAANPTSQSFVKDRRTACSSQYPVSKSFSTHAKMRKALRASEDAGDDLDASDKSKLPSWPLALVFPLWLTYISNQWSRFSLTYIVDFGPSATAFKAMNVDLSLDQSQYALLATVAFTTLFAVASLGAGVASDRFNRKTLVIASVATWSLATYGESVSSSFEQLVACRVLMGLACAFSTPTAYTLIKDYVPLARQSVASSFYGTGVAIASGLSSLIILLDDAVGWRSALQLVTLFGIVATGASVVLLPDDEKVLDDAVVESKQETPTFLSNLGSIVSVRRVQWIYLASFLRFCSGLCIGVWGAPFFRMEFADAQATYSVVQAGISAVGATMSGVLGGLAADALLESSSPSTLDPQGRKLLVPLIGSLLAAPAWYFAVQTNQPFDTAMVWLAVEYFVAECWFGPTISCLQASVPKGTGGTAQGLFTLTGALANFAPSILGYIYAKSIDGAQSSSSELSTLLIGAVCAGYVSSAGCFALAALARPVADGVDLRKEA
jgi:MFS family permease